MMMPQYFWEGKNFPSMSFKQHMHNDYYNLFLDDDPTRIPHKLTWIELPLVEWTIVRSYDEFVNYINVHGIPARVSFDHDLGTTAYQEYSRAINSNGVINYDNIKERTGMECAKFLAEQCVEKGVPIPDYFIHTLNPIGKENIRSILESARKVLTESK